MSFNKRPMWRRIAEDLELPKRLRPRVFFPVLALVALVGLYGGGVGKAQVNHVYGALTGSKAADGTISWTGQGSDSVKACGSGQTPFLHWIFTTGGNSSVTSATLTVSGDASGGGAMSDHGGSWTIDTAYSGSGAPTTGSVSASVSYTGTLGNGNPNLVISDGCYGSGITSTTTTQSTTTGTTQTTTTVGTTTTVPTTTTVGTTTTVPTTTTVGTTTTVPVTTTVTTPGQTTTVTNTVTTPGGTNTVTTPGQTQTVTVPGPTQTVTVTTPGPTTTVTNTVTVRTPGKTKVIIKHKVTVHVVHVKPPTGYSYTK